MDNPMICDQSEFLVRSLLRILYPFTDQLDPLVSQSEEACCNCTLKPYTVGCWCSETWDISGAVTELTVVGYGQER